MDAIYPLICPEEGHIYFWVATEYWDKSKWMRHDRGTCTAIAHKIRERERVGDWKTITLKDIRKDIEYTQFKGTGTRIGSPYTRL